MSSKQTTSSSAHTFISNWQLAFLNQQKETVEMINLHEGFYLAG